MTPSRGLSLRIMLAAALMVAASSRVLAAEETGTAQLSLQFHRGEDEVPPPPEPRPPVIEFAKPSCAVGGSGISSGRFNNPIDIVVDAKENFWVLDQGNSRIQRFDDKCEYISNFGESGIRAGQFNKPLSMVMDNAGFLYVVDTGNHRLQKFELSGKLLLMWGGLGSTKGSFNAPTDVTFDAENTVYVADTGNQRIQKFTPSGKFIEEWNRYMFRKEREIGNFDNLVALGYSDDRFGYILALDDKAKIIQTFELDGDLAGILALKPTGDFHPVKFKVDNTNELIYIADAAGNRVLRYSKAGAFQGDLKGDRDSFMHPTGLFVDPAQYRLYVVDSGNNRVVKFYLK